MLGRCGRQGEGHRLNPFGSARTTSGSLTSESHPLIIKHHTLSLPQTPCSTSFCLRHCMSINSNKAICYVCLSVCLSVCRLTPSIGKTDSVPASSCKEVRDVLSNECSGRPQSGTYWINMTEQCTGDNKTMRVGQKHMLLGVQQVESWVRSKMELQMETE